ncbi:MAG: aspartate ammonia-lyase [Armatimonadetes bacterium]|nr:aspartate ammonia-lyase [Armatimonadota bacterium]
METRIERDPLGEVAVPAAALYGAQTQRAVENFPISNLRAHPLFIRATAQIKKAAACANAEIGRLAPDRAAAIVQAADEVIAGKWNDQFVVDVFQAGAGTSHNMNANEVIANRANEILGGRRGEYRPIHPNDHVNMGQSTNDVIPTAIRLAALDLLGDLQAATAELADALRDRATEFYPILKSGRTHLQDATPIRLGQEFGGYATAVEAALTNLEATRPRLTALGLGGSAVGTGLNAGKRYRKAAVRFLSEQTGRDLYSAPDLVAAMQDMSPFLDLSGALRHLAVTLTRIANDFRLLASGPTTGLAEISLPAVQPGSSIMPGKVNPVIAEMLNMVCYHVIGNDTAVMMGVQAGQMELNVMMPLIAHELFQAEQVLANGVRVFARRCVRGITADAARCRHYAERSVAVVTALSPVIGYLRAAEIAKEAVASGRTIREVALERQAVPPEQLDALLDLAAMADAAEW